MIRVEPAPEPATFDERVRQPGLRFVAEKGGEIPATSFPPYWRSALDDLLSAYHHICAYVCIYIEEVMGPTVGHMIPKSLARDRVYEWSNYRLACSLMNSRKGTATNVLDPFEIQDGWFALTPFFEVIAGTGLDPDTHRRVESTIEQLKLNDRKCRQPRQGWADAYLQGKIDFAFLSRRAPFVARELARQGRLLAGDQ